LRIALVTMPFFGADRPSLQLGLLKAVAMGEGVACDTVHLNLDLAAEIGAERYEFLSLHRGPLTGEWLFAPAAFGDEVDGDEAAFFEAFPDELRLVDEHLDGGRTELARLRRSVLPDYVRRCVDAIDWSAYHLVGFTLTFQQTCASLALARAIRDRTEWPRLVFGGNAVAGEMGLELVRVFPWVDHVVIGEAEVSFAQFLRVLASGGDVAEVPGVATKRADIVRYVPATEPPDLDRSPVPDFDEYFERSAKLSLDSEHGYPVALPIETSRGCWWGDKHNCTFCGRPGAGTSYRSKSATRVLSELAEHAGRYRRTRFDAVDEILDMGYIRALFGELGERGLDYEFFYEVKSHLNRHQLAVLHRGGVRALQPGIESLSTHVLALMDKGSTMLKNVRLLKWAAYFGIDVYWNLLWGFPGETEGDYADQLRLCQLITHLQPPGGDTRIWLQRFSPYFVDRERYPLSEVRPERSYELVYPPQVRLERLAATFDYRMGDVVEFSAVQPLLAFLGAWRERWRSDRRDALSYRRVPDGILIDDRRSLSPGGAIGTCRVDGVWADIYEACSESMRDVDEVVALLHATVPRQQVLSPDGVLAALHTFCQQGLMVAENGRYLSLAIPRNHRWRSSQLSSSYTKPTSES